MYRIKTLNKISANGLNVFEQNRYQIGTEVEMEDGILVRSTAMHEYEFPETLRAIARAGAGTNNIPIDRCNEAGIVVFNSPGANANAVKELVVCALLMSCRKIVQGENWVRDQVAMGVDVESVVEKGKSQFIGPELSGKTLGVIGLGAIGVLVANIATKLGMTVYGYDPFLSVEGALSLSRLVNRAMDLDTIYKNSDFITIHVPQVKETKGMLDADAFRAMKNGTAIINMARGGLVNDDDMLVALETGKVSTYVTDFPNNKILTGKNVIPIPHLGASTPESEENCAFMAASQLKDYLENGNIKNSVNLPNVEQDWSGMARLCVIHHNIPGMIANLTAVLHQANINVENLTNKSKGEMAYTLIDLSSVATDTIADALRQVEGVLRVRLIRH